MLRLKVHRAEIAQRRGHQDALACVLAGTERDLANQVTRRGDLVSRGLVPASAFSVLLAVLVHLERDSANDDHTNGDGNNPSIAPVDRAEQDFEYVRFHGCLPITAGRQPDLSGHLLPAFRIGLV